MIRFNLEQQKGISDISGNISVAWFTGGVIAPLFLTTKSPNEFLVSFTLGFTMFAVFVYISLKFKEQI